MEIAQKKILHVCARHPHASPEMLERWGVEHQQAWPVEKALPTLLEDLHPLLTDFAVRVAILLDWAELEEEIVVSSSQM
jgi:hypothetical protein